MYDKTTFGYMWFSLALFAIIKFQIMLACLWSRVLLAKLTSSQLVKKFPAIYGTLRFIFAFTSAHRPSLSWARSIQSMSPPSHFCCCKWTWPIQAPNIPCTYQITVLLKYSKIGCVYVVCWICIVDSHHVREV